MVGWELIKNAHTELCQLGVFNADGEDLEEELSVIGSHLKSFHPIEQLANLGTGLRRDKRQVFEKVNHER